MKRHRQDLVGIDFNQILKAGARNMLDQAMRGEQTRMREASVHRYDTTQELSVLVFEERSNPPLWRMETLGTLPNDLPTVKVWDPEPAFLQAEMRNKLGGLFLVYDVCATPEEARKLSCKIVIREMGTIRLRDADRFEGERG